MQSVRVRDPFSFVAPQYLRDEEDEEILRIVEMARRILEVPTCVVNVPDGDNFCVAAATGTDVRSFPRVGSMCNTVLQSGAEVVVPDFSKTTEHRDVSERFGINFYAGIPVCAPSGEPVASLCVFGPDAVEWNREKTEILRNFGTGISRRLEVLDTAARLRSEQASLKSHERFFYDSLDLNCVASVEGRFVDLNRQWSEVLGYSMEVLLSTPFAEFIHPEDVASTQEAIVDLMQERRVVRFRNRYRHAAGHYLWLEWNAFPPTNDQPHIFASARVVTHLVEAAAELETRKRVLDVIGSAHSDFIASGGNNEWWDGLLGELLAVTGSEYGFIGVTGEDDEGPFLRTLAITNIAWNSETRRFYEENAPTGMVFRNMETLFGRAIVEQKVVLANDVANDPRAGGRPHGHPDLNTFAGLPILNDQSMVGLVGLANRANGYDRSVVDTVEPVLGLLGTVIQNHNLEAQRHAVEGKLERSRNMQSQLLTASDTGYIALKFDGEVLFANPRFAELTRESASTKQGAVNDLSTRLTTWFGPGSLVDDVLAMIEEGHREDIQVDETKLFPGSRDETPVRVRASLFRDELEEGGLLLSLTDRSADHRLVDSERMNLMLEVRIEDLKRTQQENEILSECVELLQSCVSLEEGLQLVERAATRLFGTTKLTIYGSTEPGSPLRLRGAPETHPPALDELTASDCWGLRARRVYAAGPGGHHLQCRHTPDAAHSTFCIPLNSLDRTVALISLPMRDDGDDSIAEQDREARRSQYIAMAQSISGALSTIALRESLERSALTDELTDLANRRCFQNEFRKTLSRFERSSEAFCFALIDIDHFKRVNDSFGHDIGDRVLRSVSRVMEAGVRGHDLIARVGGEEFGLVLTGLSEADALNRLNVLREAVSAECRAGSEPVHVSIGAVHSDVLQQPVTYKLLYRLADQALYRAKDNGRNRVEMEDSG